MRKFFGGWNQSPVHLLARSKVSLKKYNLRSAFSQIQYMMQKGIAASILRVQGNICMH